MFLLAYTVYDNDGVCVSSGVVFKQRSCYSWQWCYCLVLITAAGRRRKSGLMGFRDTLDVRTRLQAIHHRADGRTMDSTLPGGYDAAETKPQFGPHDKPDVAGQLRDVTGALRSISRRHWGGSMTCVMA